MKLPDDVIAHIQQFVRYDLSTSIGCTMFARQISEIRGEHISANTIKRAFGIIESTSSPSQYTLDLIARGIGYKNWEVLIGLGLMRRTSLFNNHCFFLMRIKIGEELLVTYLPNREIILQCIAPAQFKVVKSLNSQLCVGDIVKAYQVTKGQPMEFKSVVRNGVDLGSYTAAIHDGILDIDIITEDNA